MAKKQDLMRLQKFLAHAGVASRRAAEEIIAAGRVSVNKKIITQLGTKVNPRQDDVRVDGKKITLPQKHVYIMLNKPRYVLSTTRDGWGDRKTVLDLVDVPERVFPVGRLDFESEGLILLTNDGELAQKLTHPSYRHEREYEVLLDRNLDRDALRRWRAGGFEVDGKPVAPMKVERLRSDAPNWLRITLTEGRKRQIREVAEQLGYPVITLVRVRFGSLKLGNLKPGAWRHLSPREVDQLKQSVARQKSLPRRKTHKTS